MIKTQLGLFWGYLIVAVIAIAAGLNFIYLTPAFMPVSIDKWLVGLAFLGCGLLQLPPLFLYINRRWFNRHWLKLSMAASVVLFAFWAVLLIYGFFEASQTSLQLPIFVSGCAAFGTWVVSRPVIDGNGK